MSGKIGIRKPKGLFHIDKFFKMTMQEGIFNIQLSN
jgi:hypothetical protein